MYKTRMMAARALQPLAGKEQLTIVLTTLLDTLPKQPLTADSRMPQSHIHGILLQVQTLGFLSFRLLGYLFFFGVHCCIMFASHEKYECGVINDECYVLYWYESGD